jgi:prephenate dehydrogenase
VRRRRAALERADVVVVCLPDAHYKAYLAELLKRSLSRGAIVIDPWSLIADSVALDFAARGIALEVYGRGDIPRNGKA